jgi:hypothetical protein
MPQCRLIQRAKCLIDPDSDCSPELPSQCTHCATRPAQVSVSATACSQPLPPNRDSQRSDETFASLHTAKSHRRTYMNLESGKGEYS